MTKNKGKGGKTRKRGKNNTSETLKRELLTKEEGQEYGVVTRMLGNGRLEATCYDGKKRQCHIRGKMRKKIWVNTGDTVLVSLRDYQDDKGDVIHKYKPEEARELKKLGELPIDAKINENDEEDEKTGNVQIDFEETEETEKKKEESEEEESEEEEEEEESEEEEEESEEEEPQKKETKKVTFEQPRYVQPSKVQGKKEGRQAKERSKISFDDL